MGNKTVRYTEEPTDKKAFTQHFDEAYSKYSHVYDVAVKILPFWKSWLKKAVPHIEGRRVLEASFGTGYLLTNYADRFETYGIDYSEKMCQVARQNCERKKIKAYIQKADVESLPFNDGFFDCIVNTMAFSGYPDGNKAMGEFHRVLKKQGKLIIIDFNYPKNMNWFGCKITRMMEKAGDIIRDMDTLFKGFGFEYTDSEIGGFGSVHLYVAKKS